MIRKGTVLSVASVIVLSTAAALAEPPQYDVTVLPVAAGFDSVFAVDRENGAVVGAAGTDRFDPLGAPVTWDGVTWTLLDAPGSSSFANGIGAATLICGTSANEPVVWQDGRRLLLPPIDGMPGGFAFDANTGGTIVGSVINDLFGTEYPAFWASPDGPGSLLRVPGKTATGTAHAINERGEIAGGATGQPMIWPTSKRPARRIALIAGAAGGEFLDINEGGDAVGRAVYPDGRTEAILYVSSTRDSIGLGSFDGAFSVANALNNSRQVVGTSSSASGVRAFLWDAGVLHDLNALVVSTNEPFVALIDAVAIDDAGAIAATAIVDSPIGTVSRVAILSPSAATP